MEITVTQIEKSLSIWQACDNERLAVFPIPMASDTVITDSRSGLLADVPSRGKAGRVASRGVRYETEDSISMVVWLSVASH